MEAVRRVAATRWTRTDGRLLDRDTRRAARTLSLRDVIVRTWPPTVQVVVVSLLAAKKPAAIIHLWHSFLSMSFEYLCRARGDGEAT